MHADYLKALQRAVDRTTRVPKLARPKGVQYWGSGRPGLVWDHAEPISLAVRALLAFFPGYWRASEEDSHLTSEMRADYLARKCYEFHGAASRFLDHCDVAHDLVLGDVLVDGAPRFSVSVDELLHAANLPSSVVCSAAGHCWITLEDGTILDATVRAALSDTSVRQSDWSPPDLIHLASWDPEQGMVRPVLDLTGLMRAHVEYVPMLVGVELARAVGGLPPVGLLPTR